jgi:cleavage stimulation factor subunit 2
MDYQEQQRIMMEEQQKQLLVQLLQLTPEQIRALPIEQQNQIIQLKQQVLGQQQ